MKKYFNKKLKMTNEDNENFKNSTKCWIWDNNDVDNDIKSRHHFNIAGKYKDSG